MSKRHFAQSLVWTAAAVLSLAAPVSIAGAQTGDPGGTMQGGGRGGDEGGFDTGWLGLLGLAGLLGLRRRDDRDTTVRRP